MHKVGFYPCSSYATMYIYLLFSGRYRTAVSYDEHMSSHFHSWKEDFTEKPERFTETIKRCKKYGLLERCKYVPVSMN